MSCTSLTFESFKRATDSSPCLRLDSFTSLAIVASVAAVDSLVTTCIHSTASSAAFLVDVCHIHSTRHDDKGIKLICQHSARLVLFQFLD
jgi:hypothetical protein